MMSGHCLLLLNGNLYLLPPRIGWEIDEDKDKDVDVDVDVDKDAEDEERGRAQTKCDN